jgi:hypothetical protein
LVRFGPVAPFIRRAPAVLAFPVEALLLAALAGLALASSASEARTALTAPRMPSVTS